MIVGIPEFWIVWSVRRVDMIYALRYIRTARELQLAENILRLPEKPLRIALPSCRITPLMGTTPPLILLPAPLPIVLYTEPLPSLNQFSTPRPGAGFSHSSRHLHTTQKFFSRKKKENHKVLSNVLLWPRKRPIYSR